MTAYNVARGKHATLGAATADSVTFATRHYTVRVTNIDATQVIYGTLDGSVPTVGGDDTFVVPAGKVREFDNMGQGIHTVGLISTAGGQYNVEARL